MEEVVLKQVKSKDERDTNVKSLVMAFATVNIPLEKVDNPKICEFLQMHVKMELPYQWL